MKLTTAGTVPVYTISGASSGRDLPDWLTRRRKRSLKDDPELANKLELLQDFSFDEASNCVRVSEDGNWIMSTGVYKPQIHLHETSQLSLSFSRHTNCENQTFIFLSANSSDYAKSLHLQTNRTLEFHNLDKKLYEVRLPRFGRDLAYIRQSTEALIPSVGLSADGSGLGEVFRLNLERGVYMAPYQVDVGGDEYGNGLQGGIDAGAVNVAAIAETTHGLCSFGTSIGTVEFFDPRSRSRVAVLEGISNAVTALEFSKSGIDLAVGNSSGTISIFDLRRPSPLRTLDQGYNYPIKNLSWLSTSTNERKLMSADKRIIKIFDDTGDLYTSVEPVVDLNHVTPIPDTGMILTANEGKQMHVFLIPSLGPAPSWCSFLDSMVEEMAEINEPRSTEVYTNYKFLTIPELKSLNLAHLVGKTNLLRPYMHGFFVASALYDQARLISNPYVWEEERAKRIKEKIEKERASRIRGSKKVKVNQKLADKIIQRQEKKGKASVEGGVLADDRFKKLFEDEEFLVDETSREFKTLNPSTKIPGQPGDLDKAKRDESDSSDEASDSDSDAEMGMPRSKSKDKLTMQVSSSKGQTDRRKDTALGMRVQKSGRVGKSRPIEVVGEQQVTFVPGSKKSGNPLVSRPAKRQDARRSASTNTFRRL